MASKNLLLFGGLFIAISLAIGVLLAAVLLYLVPLVVMLLTSFKTPEDITTGNLLSWPAVITGIGWVKAWGAVSGYLPASFTLGKLGLASTTGGLVLVHVVYGLAFTTLFFRNFYVSIPDALVKAALTIFRRIILPMSTPIIMVCLIWQFTQIWNDFLFGVVFSSGDSQPITVALNKDLRQRPAGYPQGHPAVDQGRRVPDPGGPVGLRQVDPDELYRRPGADHRRPSSSA